jgi:hypothetical protein
MHYGHQYVYMLASLAKDQKNESYYQKENQRHSAFLTWLLQSAPVIIFFQ